MKEAKKVNTFIKVGIGLVIVAAVVYLIAGCAAMPQSFDQRLAVVNITFIGTVNSATKAVQVGVLPAEDARKLQVIMEEARTFLDQAKAVADLGDTATAEGKLELASGIIVQIQEYLISLEDENERSRINDDDRSGAGNLESNHDSRSANLRNRF